MNITYILGNGFDIQLGLKSRYSDFLAEYVKPKDGDSENVRAFREYLKERPNCEWWSDAEKAMGKDLGRFSDETVEVYREQLINFQDELVEYLQTQESECSWDEAEKIRDKFAMFLRKSLSNMRVDEYRAACSESKRYYFISLNYTNLIDRILQCCKNSGGNIIYKDPGRNSRVQDTLGKLCHVHGDLNSEIIMGVNDESQLVINPELTIDNEIRWQFLKGEMGRQSPWARDSTAKNFISQSDLIVVYGVSYGETDARWWNEITEWLEHNPQRRLIAFIYDINDKINSRVAYVRISYENRKKEEILEKLGISKEAAYFDILKEQVYIADATKGLHLRELIHPEEAIAAMKENDKGEV